jgi:hypothetical protein
MDVHSVGFLENWGFGDFQFLKSNPNEPEQPIETSHLDSIDLPSISSRSDLPRESRSCATTPGHWLLRVWPRFKGPTASLFPEQDALCRIDDVVFAGPQVGRAPLTD